MVPAEELTTRGSMSQGIWRGGAVPSLGCGAGDVILCTCPTHRTLRQKE